MDETTELMTELTMINMFASELIRLGSVDFEFTVYLTDCYVYGSDFEADWEQKRIMWSKNRLWVNVSRMMENRGLLKVFRELMADYLPWL